MRRREFITIAGSVAAWPFVASVQSQERLRLIGILSGLAESDPQTQAHVSALMNSLGELGWIEGKNIRIEKRFSAGNPAQLPALARELTQMRCEIIVAEAAQGVDAAREATRTIPIVMTYVGDALGPG